MKNFPTPLPLRLDCQIFCPGFELGFLGLDSTMSSFEPRLIFLAAVLFFLGSSVLLSLLLWYSDLYLWGARIWSETRSFYILAFILSSLVCIEIGATPIGHSYLCSFVCIGCSCERPKTKPRNRFQLEFDFEQDPIFFHLLVKEWPRVILSYIEESDAAVMCL